MVFFFLIQRKIDSRSTQTVLYSAAMHLARLSLPAEDEGEGGNGWLESWKCLMNSPCESYNHVKMYRNFWHRLAAGNQSCAAPAGHEQESDLTYLSWRNVGKLKPEMMKNSYLVRRNHRLVLKTNPRLWKETSLSLKRLQWKTAHRHWDKFGSWKSPR